VAVVEGKRKAYVGCIRFVQGIKKPENRSGKDAQYDRLPISFIETQHIQYGNNKTH
jgi:hypothetical protein